MLIASGNLRKIKEHLDDNQIEVARMVDKSEKRGTIEWPRDARGANMATLRDHLPVPQSMDLVEDFMDRRRAIFTNRMRTQDPSRKRNRNEDEAPSEAIAA